MVSRVRLGRCNAQHFAICAATLGARRFVSCPFTVSMKFTVRSTLLRSLRVVASPPARSERHSLLEAATIVIGRMLRVGARHTLSVQT